jgi:protein TonB
MALLLLPGFRGGSSILPGTVGPPVFSLVNIEVPAAALPKPPPLVTSPAPAVPPPAAGYPAADEAPSAETAVPRDTAAAALSQAAPAETAVPAAGGAAPEAAPAIIPAAPGAVSAAPGAGQNSARNAAGGAGAAAERKALAAAYTRRNFDHIQRRIQEKLVYPPQARRTGAQGRAEAVFTVYPDGGVGGLEILTGSGQAILDQALLDAIRAAAPFPPPPVQVRLIMPLTFRLK